MRVKLHREGTNILIVGLTLVLLINVPLWLWVRPMVWAIVSSAVFGVTYLLAVNFFRSPKRYYKGERLNTVVSLSLIHISEPTRQYS